MIRRRQGVLLLAWKELEDATMSKESQARARAEAEKIFAALPLAEVRRSRELSQEQLAETLDMPQGNISKARATR